MKKTVQNKRGTSVLYAVIPIMFVLGAVLGVIAPKMFPPIAFLGEIYVRLLKLLVIPLLMTQIIVSVSGTVGVFRGRLLRVILLFVAMFVVSFCITAILVSVLGPGRGMDLFGAEWDGTPAATSLSAFFKSIVPDNIFAAMSAGSILPCILFAFAAGIAAAAVKADKTIAVCRELSGLFSRLLEYIMWYAPIGVFSLIGSAAADCGAALAGACLRYILIAWGGCLIVTALVMILPVWIYAKISPLTYLRRVSRIWVITLSTCSSAATLPHTIRVCNEEFGVPEDITGVVVPLGCTIHMCGGAVSFCLLGLFTMQMAGSPLTLGTFLYMLLIATLMNMAAPGIPGGGIVLGATYLGILGAPTGFIGLYSGIYRVLDMAYTSLNVTGDITANVLAAEYEKRCSGTKKKK